MRRNVRTPPKPREYEVTVTVTVMAPNKDAAIIAMENQVDRMIDWTGGEIELNKMSAKLKRKPKKVKVRFQGF